MQVQCFVCDKVFQRKPSHAAKIKDGRHTCSKSCADTKKELVFVERMESRLQVGCFEEWLREQYVTLRRSTRQISKIMYGHEKQSSSVLKFLHRYGIPVRKGSEAVKTQWENNLERKKRQAAAAVRYLGEGTPSREKLKGIMKSQQYRLNSSKAKQGDKNPMTGIIGPDHPKWNPERTAEQRAQERKLNKDVKWRQTVFKRDNFTCQACGDNTGGNLVAHHLNSYHWDIKGRHDPDNGLTLCDGCHKSFHSQYGYKNNTANQMDEFMSILL